MDRPPTALPIQSNAMVTPQFYTQPQPMMPSYVQPVPVYHTPEQGLKHDLSPLTSIEGDHDGKRVCTRSAETNDGDVIVMERSIREFTLMDIMTELKKVATKEDLTEIKSSLL